MKHITALENVQRRATKLIPGYKELDYKERLIRLNLPTLSYRRLRGDMIEISRLALSIAICAIGETVFYLAKIN